MINLKKIVFLSLLIFIIDQIVKIIIGFNIPLNSSITIIKNFFYISNVHNYGAAFSIFNGNRIFLIIVSLFALIFVYHYMLKNKEHSSLEICIYSLLIGGILGNLFDRIVYGYVVDFFNFYIFNYNYPIFNIADVCIVVSIFLIIFDTLRGKHSDN